MYMKYEARVKVYTVRVRLDKLRWIVMRHTQKTRITTFRRNLRAKSSDQKAKVASDKSLTEKESSE